MRKSGRPDLGWGGVRGGGRRYFAGYVLEHAVDIRRVAQIAACGARSRLGWSPDTAERHAAAGH